MPVGMGVPPAKSHEELCEVNKLGTRGEQKAGFFDPVAAEDRPGGLSYCAMAASGFRSLKNAAAAAT
jgi:hypothetical protein